MVEVHCPVCGSFLIEGAKRRYETLREHCAASTRAAPLRPTLVCANRACANQACATQRYGIFWDPAVGTADFYVGADWPDAKVLAKLRGAM